MTKEISDKQAKSPVGIKKFVMIIFLDFLFKTKSIPATE